LDTSEILAPLRNAAIARKLTFGRRDIRENDHRKGEWLWHC
jgi:hypothetical protein